MRSTKEVKGKILAYKEKGLSLFATSSFQTHSIPLLHIISTIDKNIPVYYLNTGFLFPETLVFKDQLQELLGLQFISLSSPVSKSQQKDGAGQLLFTSDPDYCCFKQNSTHGTRAESKRCVDQRYS